MKRQVVPEAHPRLHVSIRIIPGRSRLLPHLLKRRTAIAALATQSDASSALKQLPP